MSNHGIVYKKLSRDSGHRRSLLANLCACLVTHGRIKTTLAKAKAVRRVVEKLITRARRYRQTGRISDYSFFKGFLYTDEAVRCLCERTKECADRCGGYTRIVKCGTRKGDGAPVAFIEFVDYRGLSADVAVDDSTSGDAGKRISKLPVAA